MTLDIQNNSLMGLFLSLPPKTEPDLPLKNVYDSDDKSLDHSRHRHPYMTTHTLNLTPNRMSESPRVGQLYKQQQPIDASTTCIDVLNCFLQDPGIYALPVVNSAKQPVALVDRHLFVEFFTRPFIREIHGRKGILRFLKGDNTPFPFSSPIVVDEATSIDDVAQMIIDAGMQHMVTGFIVTDDGTYLGVANGHDLLNEITRRKQADLYFLAHYDHLTGVPNRMLFGDRLMQACRDASRSGSLVGLMFVDVDRFKQVNDSMGHGFGDQLLRLVSERLKSCAREADTVARLGGDEFAILMDGLRDVNDPRIVASRIIESMAEPYVIVGQSLSITVSIGIAIFPLDDTEVAPLLAKADTAMYAAKAAGRNAIRVYAPDLAMYNVEQMSLETDLRMALQRDEFIVHYQPKINLHTNEVVGAEALMRWQHPARGLLSPIHFIALAEESGLIVGIGEWVLRQACIQHCRWRDAGMPDIQVAVNVSALQFRQEGFVDMVKAIVAETGIEPRHIELELTEGVVMINASDVLETLNELKSMGLRLAIDDFGTGFSSLNYLRRFPIDVLKIDQSFVRGIENTPVNASIVRAVVALAKSLSMETVAEGAESKAELDMVRSCLCDGVQGFHYARPLAPEVFVDWYDGYRNKPAKKDNEV